jgi:predicted RNA-binding Zn-ribbon protein involved in translation (DUF1610 family)
MGLFCLIKLHNWAPIKAFYTNLVDDKGISVGTAESWTGFECTRCGERKITNHICRAQSAGATQNAYDWLNEKRNKLQDLNI